MRLWRSTFMVVALVLTLAVPAFAQGNTQQSDMVTKTFKLTIYGTPAADQVFELNYATREQAEQPNPNLPTIEWCGPGPDPANSPRVSTEPCKGNGTTYTYTVKFPRGTQIAYRYFTGRYSDFQGTFDEFGKSYDGMMPNGPEDYETLNSDMTNSAWYRFGSTNQQTPSQMPATGAGGASGSSLPVGALYLALPVVLAAGYALRRQWQAR